MSIKQAIEALPPLPEPAVNDHPSKSWHSFTADQMREYALAALRSMPAEPQRLWLWKNFVDGRPEYWAFDNAYPINMDNGDPQTLGVPCGYALFKPSRAARTVPDEQVLQEIARALKEKNNG